MAHITIRINGYAYTIGCEDGQEAHLTRMAEEVDRRIIHIRKNFGSQSGEARLLMMASLLLADELYDARTHQASLAETTNVAPPPPTKADQERRARLRRIAARAEEIAADMTDS